ncbi:response regulator [Epibacterium sp. SM1979]|uniref:Sensory/regulatory protein RpfC n=2 Tax=Tritonibacter litoralis TaxID=2662264 RepID=A0A843YGF6_9RHOB|nr:response regulator [Tritonibacter litoralis]
MSPATCPVAKHERRYSPVGLLQRYAGHKVDHLNTRLLFAVGWCSFVAVMASFEIAMICLALVVAGDLVETYFMRRLSAARIDEIDEQRAKRISIAAGTFDAVCFVIAASLPTYLCCLEPEYGHAHWKPIFSIYLLMGAGIAHLMFVPLNPIGVIIRAVIYFVVPLGILVSGGPHHEFGYYAHELDIGGVVIFALTSIWIARLVQSRHVRRLQTELKQARQQRELQNAYAQMYSQQVEARRLALVAESANDSVMIINRDFRITWVNESFTRITGYTAKDAIGQRPADLLNCDETDLDEVADMNARLIKGDTVRTVLFSRRKDGRRIWLETSQVPMLNAAGELETLIAVERDITATKEHEKELEEARRAAEEGARTKAEFLATMSHEIRTPLNGVIGMTQLLEHTQLDEDQRKYAETIHSSARSLLALINDVLELSKMDARDVTLTPTNFDVRRCFENTIDLLKPLAQEKSIYFELDVASDVPEVLHGDDRRITQILMNVVGNALKFTAKGGVRVVVDVSGTPKAPKLNFHVFDTGIGIPEELQARIFERFSQADTAISRKFGGTGLGLTISQRLAHAMGGTITVSSAEGQGSCFTTQLQLAPACQLAEVPEKRSPQEVDLNGARILVADDNQVNRLLVQKFLKGTGAQLCFAVDGQEAIDRTIELEPQVILMDLSMPNVSGLEATQSIRQSSVPQPYIIAVTANAFDEDRDACLKAGMDEFLSKPVSRQQLVESLVLAFSQHDLGTPLSLCAEPGAALQTEKTVR